MKQLLQFILALSPWLAGGAELTATVRQMARPVLIRNEHNSLLQLAINAKRPFVQVRAIKVTLEGAHNLESLQFYFTGGASGFSSEKPFGERMRARKEITFNGHARLAAGRIIFGCRAASGRRRICRARWMREF